MASNEVIETRGWQVGKCLTDCLRHMLANHVACDVTFDVQSTGKPHVKNPAHNLMLQARSPVFEAMFSGDFVEADGNVVITDMEPDPFKDLLTYMYTDEITLTGENIILLMCAAKKYTLENLLDECDEFLENEICVDNVCSILTHSLIQQDEKLVNTCLDLISPNAKAVVKTEAFYKMSHDALLKVVSCDQLAHGVEAELFEACLEWGKRRVPDSNDATDEEIRDILGTECLHKIRFPYIPLKDFAGKFGKTSVLTTEEKSLIYPVLINQEEHYIKALSALGFDVASRIIKAKRYEHVSEMLYTADVLSETDSKEEFAFSASKPIQLRDFTFHGGIKDSEHDVKITIHNTTEQGDPCVQIRQKIRATDNYKSIPVYFRKTPISVNTKYKVCVTCKGTEKTAFSWKPIMNAKADNLTISSTSVECPLYYTDTDKIGAGFVAELFYREHFIYTSENVMRVLPFL